MKKSNKTLLLGVGLGLGLLLLSSCTNTFCSTSDQANLLYPYEQGITTYVSSLEEVPESYRDSAKQVFEGNDNLYAYVPITEEGEYGAIGADFLSTSVISAAKSNGYPIPTQTYFAAIDQKVVEIAVDAYIADHPDLGLTRETISAEYVSAYDSEGNLKEPEAAALRQFGYLKFFGPSDNQVLWGYYDAWLEEFKASDEPGLGYLNCPTSDFLTLYKDTTLNRITSARSCIATQDGYYGHYGADENWTVAIVAKDYSYAWSRGFLEGLLIYPIAWATDSLAYSIDPLLSGAAQLLALLVVTVVIRLLFMGISFPSTMNQQKMQALQPQLAKLQAKYPNANTNQAQKARLAQEQMALYKRNKIHPFLSLLLPLVIQFPLFICVWAAFQGSSALSSGLFLNLSLAKTIQSALFDFSGTWYLNTNGWWTALVMFLLMAAGQILAMMIPQMLQKKRTKKVARLTRNPAMEKQQKTTRWMMIGMSIFTIFMGFFLVSAMAFYWFVGSLMQIAQTLIMHVILLKTQKKKERKY